MVDRTVMAMDRFCRGSFISLHTDDDEDTSSDGELVQEYY
jgi:hypothetical protein